MSSHQQRALTTVTSNNGGTAAFTTVSSTTPTTSDAENANVSNVASHTYSTNNLASGVCDSGNSDGNNNNNNNNHNTYSASLTDTTVAPSSSSTTVTTTATASGTSNLNNYYESLRNNVITLLEHVRLPTATGHQNAISGTTSVPTPNTYAVSTPMSVMSSNPHNTYVTHPTLIPPSPLPTASIATTNPSVSLYGSAAHHLSSTHTGHSLGPPHTAVVAAPPPPHAYTVHHTAGYSSHDHFDSYISKLQSLCVPPDVYALPDDGTRPVYDTVRSSLHQDYTLMPTPI